jgi:2-methylisocitrate lyase-like PEP mutase family enzyme
MIAQLASPSPVIADADTGYGGPVMCDRTIKLYHQAGIAGLHVEDQQLTKRCGHLLGKELVSREEYATRVQAMVNARKQVQSDIVIIARTDAVQKYGIDEAINRMKLAISIGADVAFVEGITTEEEAKKVVQDLSPTPLLLNLVANGVTPRWSAAEAQRMGYQICIFPCANFVPAMIAMERSMKALAASGSDVAACESVSVRDFFVGVGLNEVMAIDQAAGAAAFKNV